MLSHPLVASPTWRPCRPPDLQLPAPLAANRAPARTAPGPGRRDSIELRERRRAPSLLAHRKDRWRLGLRPVEAHHHAGRALRRGQSVRLRFPALRVLLDADRRWPVLVLPEARQHRRADQVAVDRVGDQPLGSCRTGGGRDQVCAGGESAPRPAAATAATKKSSNWRTTSASRYSTALWAAISADHAARNAGSQPARTARST